VARPSGLLALACVAFAYAWPMQVTGDNQNAHYALVKALARGVPYIDETLRETGDLQSHDVIEVGGHVYTVKAPGLAIAAQPAYALARLAGMRTTGDPMRVLWVLTVLTSAIATVALVVLVRDLADGLERGFGTATAVILGLGALTLPFATLFFSHALGTTLLFAAFWLLWRERKHPGLGRIVASGALVGGSVAVEHPTIWVAPILAVYAVAAGEHLKRFAAFAAGGLAGVLPLLLFNTWAFGDPLHTPYQDYWQARPDFSPLALPAWDEFSKIMFSSLGLLVLAPVLLAAGGGLVLMYRRGTRAEALVCASVPLVLIGYFSANNAFGGLGPPRYLTPMMPFALLPLAVALRRFPVTTGVLAAITVFQAVVQTGTGPLAAYDGAWLQRAIERDFMATAAMFVDVSGWYAILPFFFAAGGAVVLAITATSAAELRLGDAGFAIVALAGWAFVAAVSSNEFGRPPSNAYVLAASSLLTVPVAIASAAVLARWRKSAQIAS
jgi:hypothetical protein